MALAWSPDLIPSSESWQLVGGSRGGGRGLTNQEQIVTGPTAYWRAALSIPINRRERILAINTMMAALDGRAGTVLVPMHDLGRAPVRSGVPRSYDARLFLTTATGAINATTLTVRRQIGGAVVPGQHFSVNGRLHRIIAVSGDDATANDVFTIQFRPWLREALPVATFLEFSKPVCEMRLGSDDTGALDLQLSRFGTVSLDLVEAF